MVKNNGTQSYITNKTGHIIKVLAQDQMESGPKTWNVFGLGSKLAYFA